MTAPICDNGFVIIHRHRSRMRFQRISTQNHKKTYTRTRHGHVPVSRRLRDVRFECEALPPSDTRPAPKRDRSSRIPHREPRADTAFQRHKPILSRSRSTRQRVMALITSWQSPPLASEIVRHISVDAHGDLALVLFERPGRPERAMTAAHPVLGRTRKGGPFRLRLYELRKIRPLLDAEGPNIAHRRGEPR